MPATELNTRKREMVQELNGFIGLKKAYSSQASQRGELLSGSKSQTERSMDSESGSSGVQQWGGGASAVAASVGRRSQRCQSVLLEELTGPVLVLLLLQPCPPRSSCRWGGRRSRTRMPR